jgi:rubrerythrin
MTELGTFGAIFKFALEFEEASVRFYSEASQRISELEALVAKAQKHVKRLERLRREAVTEMILEPLRGLQAADYQVDWSVREPDMMMAQAMAIEEAGRRFYTDAAAQIPIIEATRAFKKLAKEHEHQRLALVDLDRE